MCSSSHMTDSDPTEIGLTVKGLPPIKGSSRSIFNPKNPPYYTRAVRLLERMQQTLRDSQWDTKERRSLGLELTITETQKGFRGDAINILGGVADVLQANRINADLSQLGNLAEASFYYDDRCIREVRYSVVRGETESYHVRVWVL